MIDKRYTKDLYRSWLLAFKGQSIKEIIGMDFATEKPDTFFYDQAEIVEKYLAVK